MLVDWFTVGAQALNFVILVWLLKRFLYKPILDAVDARERRIAAELDGAAAKMAEALKQREEYERKNAELDQQRAALLRKAGEEAGAERERLLENARKAADSLRDTLQKAQRGDAQRLEDAVRRRIQSEVFAIARKFLADLADTSLEERVSAVFIGRLRSMDGKAREVLGSALRSGSKPALLRSAFDLPAAPRAAIQRALNEVFSAEIPIRFESEPDLVGGFELIANGQKVAWNIADCIGSLEKGLGDLFEPAANRP